MEVAVTRIYRAVLSGEKVAVYGDFDADGILLPLSWFRDYEPLMSKPFRISPPHQ